jgi:hypothetical protein
MSIGRKKKVAKKPFQKSFQQGKNGVYSQLFVLSPVQNIEGNEY